MPKPKNTRLSVFKGREAKLNRAIFQTLALKGPQTIYDIHKQIRTQRGLKHAKYASVNKRVRSLEESGYIKRSGVRRTKAGFDAVIFGLLPRAYLAMLFDFTSLEDLVCMLDEESISAILTIVLDALR